jgi:hypothetical protein
MLRFVLQAPVVTGRSAHRVVWLTAECKGA